MSQNLKKVARIARFTAAWCLFLPLLYAGNKGATKPPLRNPGLILRLIRRGRILLAWEAFWSGWNPVFTVEITRPLYELCGGNKRPFFATMMVFLYSGVFLHAMFGAILGFELTAIISLLGGNGLSHAQFSLSWMTVVTYLLFGFPVAVSKWMRNRRALHA